MKRLPNYIGVPDEELESLENLFNYMEMQRTMASNLAQFQQNKEYLQQQLELYRSKKKKRRIQFLILISLILIIIGVFVI